MRATALAVQSLLQVPLQVKIVVANVAVAALACVLGLREGTIIGAAAGAALVLLVNAVIVRIALAPLRQLEQVAEQVERGEMDVRARGSPLADRDIARLVRAFNGALDRQAEYRRRLRSLALRSLRSEEDQSRRLAVALREGAGQRLASVLLRLRMVPAGEDGADAVAALAEEARKEIAGALQLLSTHAGDRAERLLEDLGITSAIEWRARQLHQTCGLEVPVHVGPIDGDLTRAARLALFQIVQEALENAGRHAGAHRVSITIGRRGDRVVADILDDGCGFRLEKERAQALGLLAMEERAAALGGALDVASDPSQGTRVHVELPARGAERVESSPTGPLGNCPTDGFLMRG